MAGRSPKTATKPRRMSSDEWHFRLSAIRNQPDDPDAVTDLAKALAAPSNFVVAKAAQIVESRSERALLRQLASALDRLMQNPAKLDPTCSALTALVKALHALDFEEPFPFFLGIRHVQMEGSFGPPVDAAVELRAASAIALARHHHPRVVNEIARLLADPEPGARLGAATALGCCGSTSAYPLLYFKTLTGDREPDVITECFASMLVLDSSAALEAITVALNGIEHAESAALALGPSRHPDAFSVLKERYESLVGGPLKNTVLVAISLCRTKEAVEYLEPLQHLLRP